MIDKALSFIADEVNKFITSKKGPDTTARLVLGSPIRMVEPQAPINTLDSPEAHPIVLSLVNIEEDKISKSPENFQRPY